MESDERIIYGIPVEDNEQDYPALNYPATLERMK